MKRGLFVLAVLGSLLLVGCAGARFSTKGGWSGPVVDESGSVIYVGSQEGRLLALRSSGDLKWSFPHESEDALGRVLYGAPATDGERVYFGTYDGELYAVDAATGEMATEWSFNPLSIGEGEHIIGGPTLAGQEQCFSQERARVEGDVLVVGTSSGSVYAFCAADGSLAWRVETQGEVWGAPAVSDGTVYVGSQDGNLYAISLDGGISRWPSFKAGGAIVAQPLVADGKVFFGALDGKVYAVNAESGTSAWREPFDGGNWFWAGVISDGESLYAVTVKGKVVALDPATGAMRWETNLNAMVISTPVLVRKQGVMRLVVVTKEGEIALLHTSDGQEDGSRIPIEDSQDGSVKVKAPLGVSESIVYVNTMDKWTTQAVDLDAGGEAFWICPPSCGAVGR